MTPAGRTAGSLTLLLLLQTSNGFEVSPTGSAAASRWRPTQDILVSTGEQACASGANEKTPAEETAVETPAAGAPEIEVSRPRVQQIREASSHNPIDWMPAEMDLHLTRTTNIAFLFKEYDRYVWAE